MSDKKINPDCPCAYDGCRRHGDCEACKKYHHERNEKTACERKA